MNKNGLYVFYGTLRKDMENYIPIRQGLKYRDTISLSGYQLYSLGDYPFAVYTGNKVHAIVVDLFEVAELSTMELIHQMELEAGYFYEEIAINGICYGIYLFQNPIPEGIFIDSGNWKEYVQS